MIKSFKDLKVYQIAFSLAMEIFKETKNFPAEEKYSITSQITRSSRSIAANISEGWAKREYQSVFKQQLVTSLGSAGETKTWIDFALACKYLSKELHFEWIKQIDEISKMLTVLHQKWK
jgi:four helix bundle protein